MKILVTVKRVVDANVKVGVKSDQSRVDLANVKMSINPFDEIAVEGAVRLKEAGVATEVIAVSCGVAQAQDTLRTALAIGADRAILIESNADLQPLAVARLLKALVDREQPRLVILGKQAIDDDSSQTGHMLAALGGLPQATFASNILIADGLATVAREVDDGADTLSLKLPALITTDLRLNEPRYVAAQKIGADIHVLIVGHKAQGAADKAAKIAGVSKVLLADAPQLEVGLAENDEATVLPIAMSYSHILAPATALRKNAMPRIAAKLDGAQISDITAVDSADTFERPIYAGNAIATVRSADPVKVITVRATSFDAVPADGGSSAPVEQINAAADCGVSRFVSREATTLNRPELTTAKTIVSGGRGLGSGENCTRVIMPLADKLWAALGASRAAVDAVFVPNDYQVCQTGKIVAPQLYVAVGISGAIQHLAGMKDSRVIVAINKDPEAPIFGVADYGLVGDLHDIVPAFVDAA